MRGVHGEKIVSAMQSEKLPKLDFIRLKQALEKYDHWIKKLNATDNDDIDLLIVELVAQLNEYKNYIDIDLIFDSEDDFLYRQKGQLKLDNTIIEEFLPIMVRKVIYKKYGDVPYEIDAQKKIFSSVFFASSLNDPQKGGGLTIKSKDQDFSISRKLYIKSSYDKAFNEEETLIQETNIGYIATEIKTNLDKTMFQEASATAHDVKIAVTGSKYILLCEWLDMTPISTATTDIDEIIILRKAKRVNSNIRSNFSTYEGRIRYREAYKKYIGDNPLDAQMFIRYINHIFALADNDNLTDLSVLDKGYF